ncbi:hypothetical protein D9Q98_010087 [Chlorella vulgaris]|uniref:Uncharacterized protein n=1 Tax=Chlorella vulgaris TaxID=3077 RepID=A0A9D4YWI1_CHLVU|nr:hypothetical protein D9Q98_010087 [Chlorella vulgaris]
MSCPAGARLARHSTSTAGLACGRSRPILAPTVERKSQPTTPRACMARASMDGGVLAPAPVRRALAHPAAFCFEFSAGALYAPCPEDVVSDKYRGLSILELQTTFDAEHPGLLDAVASAAAGMTPASAAQLLRHLEAELPPALNDVAPSGDCVLVAISPGLLPLLDRAAECCEASLHGDQLPASVAIARAALSLLSCVRFSSGESASPYSTVAIRCKQALLAAYNAGASVVEEDVVELEAVCARASSWLWLTPHFGLRFAGAREAFLARGWSTAELAVRFAEAYTSLLVRGRYQRVDSKSLLVVRAGMCHRLSLTQAERLLKQLQHHSLSLTLHEALEQRTVALRCLSSLQPQPTIRANAPRVLV